MAPVTSRNIVGPQAPRKTALADTPAQRHGATRMTDGGTLCYGNAMPDRNEHSWPPVVGKRQHGNDEDSGDRRLLDALEIEAMSHGKHAIARAEGKVIFVAGGAPGDVAVVEIVETKPRFSRAVLRALRQRSENRRTPPCPYVPLCGGCSWQHLTYAAQLDAKQRNLGDHLTRIGGLENPTIRPVLGSPAQWRYRNRLNLRVAGSRLGFYRAESHELVEIDACLIATETIERGLLCARRWLAGLSTIIRRLSITASENDDAVVLAANCEGALASTDEESIPKRLAALRAAGLRGVVMFGKRWWRGWGDFRVTRKVDDGTQLTTTAGEFTQVNSAANEALVRTVLALSRLEPEDRVLDLYCGAGNLTLPVARRVARVVGVERSSRAIADARDNARRLGLENCTFVCAPAEEEAARLADAAAKQSLVIVDPPRGGAARVLDSILRLNPQRMVYVSCDPPTLARDIRTLARHGYRFEEARPIDLFPHTHHLEVVAALSRA